MCGRLNVIDDPWVIDLMAALGIQLNIKTNRDLRPTQEVATVAAPVFRGYHARFPVFIPQEGARDWVLSDSESASRLMPVMGGQGIVVEPA